MLNDNNTKSIVNWSSRRNSEQRLRHRPHVVNTANNRGDTNVRYYSSVDADIYFGDLFIDEVVTISWQISQNVLPIFGYNSFTFDDLAVGNRLVQGQFVVNFTKANYLLTVQDTLKKISRKSYGVDSQAISTDEDLYRRKRNSAMLDFGFDIVIGYGEKNEADFQEKTVLDCCQITGCSQVLDYEGNPIMETYTFLARDIKEISSVENSINENLEESNNTITMDINILNSKINIKDSNTLVEIEYQSSEQLLAANLSIKNVDSIVFAIAKELTVNHNSLTVSLSDKEKKAINEYCAKNDINSIDGTISYAFQSGNDVSNKEINIILKVDR